jgi:hypothetical protein
MKIFSTIPPIAVNLLFACAVFSQSSFELANLDLPLVNAPVFDAQGVPLAGPRYLVELWGAATPDALAPLVDLARGSVRDIVPFMTRGYFIIETATNSRANATCLIWRRKQLLGVRGLATKAGAPSRIFIPNASTQGPPTSSAVQVNQEEISARAFSP